MAPSPQQSSAPPQVGGDGGPSPGAHADAGPNGGQNAEPSVESEALGNYLYYTCIVLAALVITWRISQYSIKMIRTVTSLNNPNQTYYSIPSRRLEWFKRNFLYSPIARKRHNQEYQLSSAINVGTLPTRLQLAFIVGYFATNVVFCVIEIPFQADFATAASKFRSRCGVLSVVNMVPLFLFAGRNNPLLGLLGISFDTFNLLHRWFGRIVVLQALAHTIAHLAKSSAASGLQHAFSNVAQTPFLLWGLVATIALLAIFVQATGVIRHAFYETFKIMHIALAILAVIGTWYHLTLHNLPQYSYLIAVIVLWIADRAARAVRLVYFNIGKAGGSALVEALPGNACRITVSLARPWSFKPGQHAYVYVPSIGLWQSHPLSVAWCEMNDISSDKLALNRQDYMVPRSMNVSFIVRARTGFTNTLYQKAIDSPDSGRLHTKCFVEGPYGGLHGLTSYGSVLMFAGGVGITHMVPHVRHLVMGYASGTVAVRRLTLVWVIQSPEHLEWIRPWMTDILALEKRRDVLRILLFVSRPRSTKEIHSPSSTVQMFPGRPNIDTLLSIELEQQVGALAVSVCGPGSLSDDVRRAVRNRHEKNPQTVCDFHEEAFSW